MLKDVQDQTSKQMEDAFNSIRTIMNLSFRNIQRLTGLIEPSVLFPEEDPFTIVTKKGTVRLEPLAYATLRYCCYIFETQNRNEITFEEIGEKIYNDQFKARSTIQNTVKRGEDVNRIGITYFYFGENIFLKFELENTE